MKPTHIQEPNFTMVPNFFFDIMPELSEAELRVMLVVIREIVGYQLLYRDEPKALSGSLIADECGMTRRGVIKGLQRACERGWLIHVDKRGPGGTSRYQLAWALPGWSAHLDTWKQASFEGQQGGERNTRVRGAINTLVNEVHRVCEPSTHPGCDPRSHTKRKGKQREINIVPGGTLSGDSSPHHRPPDADSFPPTQDTDTLMTETDSDPVVDYPGAVPRQARETQHPLDDSDRPEPLIAHFQAIFGSHITFSPEQQARLQANIRYQRADGGTVMWEESLEDLVRCNHDFRTFVTQRLKTFKNLCQQKGQAPSVSSIITNLLDFERQGKNDAWDGWLVYQRKHRHASYDTDYRPPQSAETTYLAGTLPPPPEPSASDSTRTRGET